MKKPVLLIALAITVIVGVTAFTFVKFMGNSADEAAAKPGDCVTVTNTSEDRADVAGANCLDEKATFKVGKVVADVNASCPEAADDYTAVVANSGPAKLCLLPNFVEGACYRSDDAYENWRRSACEGDETRKVTKVISGTNDASGCPENDGLAYPEPPITYCLAGI